MLGRRTMLTTGAAFALLPGARGAESRLKLRGTPVQGGLVIGVAEPNARVQIDGTMAHVSPGGLFVLGLGYDAEKSVEITASYTDGFGETVAVTPQKRTYDIQAINGLPEKYVEPPPDVIQRMKREREHIWTVREADTDGIGFSEPLDWPFAGRLSGIFGSQRILNGKPMAPHLGVDIAAPEGTPVHAAADGVVSIADDYYLEGGFTLLDHGHGVSSCYLHQSQRLVKAGDAVKRGDVIGHVGMTGRATGPHCHWGLCWFQLKLDPSRATATPEPPAA